MQLGQKVSKNYRKVSDDPWLFYDIGHHNIIHILFYLGRAPELSVVTKEQYDKLVAEVNELRERFNPVGVPEFPENIEIMKSLRRGASLTDAMAALQISARLEAFEKTFGIMIPLLTTLALQTPGVNLKDFTDLAKDYGVQVPQEIEMIELKRETRENLLEEEPKDCVTYEELELVIVEYYYSFRR